MSKPAKHAPSARRPRASAHPAFVARQLATLFQVNRFMTSIDDLDELLRLVMREASRSVGAEASSIALYDPVRDDLFFRVALGAKGAQVQQVRLSKETGIIGAVARTGKVLNVKDAHRDRRFDASVDKRTGFVTRAILAMPITHKGQLTAVLEVMNKQGPPGYFTQEDAALLRVVGTQAGIAIENARLYDDLAREHARLAAAHQQLQDAQQQLIQAERLSAVGRFASTIVHDFKNPMTAVRSFCELLVGGQLDQGDVAELSRTIIGEIDRLVKMAQEILQFSRGDMTLDCASVALDELVAQVAALLRPECESQGIALRTELQCRTTVWLDADRLRRVIYNMAGNARDAMAGGGTLTVRTQRAGDRARLVFQDTGQGIPAEIRGTLFQPFVTAGKQHGTGLGLAVTRRIVEMHGGAISVTTKCAGEGGTDAHGTTFTIDLPIGDPAAVTPTRTPVR